MSDKRVLTIANHLGSVGGTEPAELAIFRNLAERGWTVDRLLRQPGGPPVGLESAGYDDDENQASIPTRFFSCRLELLGTISGAISGSVTRRRRSFTSTMPAMSRIGTRDRRNGTCTGGGAPARPAAIPPAALADMRLDPPD